MGHRCHLDIAWASGTQCPLSQWNLMEASVHCDIAGPRGNPGDLCDAMQSPGAKCQLLTQQGLLEAIWILPWQTEFSVHCGVAQAHEQQESKVTPWNLGELRWSQHKSS